SDIHSRCLTVTGFWSGWYAAMLYSVEGASPFPMRYRRSISLLACYLIAIPGFSWWATGHRTVARIAASHLTPAARARVAQILGVRDTPAAVAAAMAKASVWPDETKKATHTGEWHYIDLTLQDGKGAIRERCPGENCVTARIELFRDQLAGRKSTGVGDRDALRYLIHFVGDVHQPLHAASNADLSGNCEQIHPFEGADTLHALWDGGIVAAINPDDHVLARHLESYIARLDPRERSRWSRGTPEEWTWESHQIARQDVYQRLHVPLEPPFFPRSCRTAPDEITRFRLVIDDLYLNDMKPVIRDQLTKAGLRLARLLNQALR